MPFTRAAYTPTDGLKNTTSFPTNPADETAARKQFQDVFDQIKDDVNVLEGELEATGAAAKIGCTGTYPTLQDFITAVLAAGSGTLPPNDSVTLDMQNSLVKTGLLASLTTTAKTSLVAAINELVSSIAGSTHTIPTGLIAQWHGLISAIPSGWSLCDGTNGTPDLRSKFIMGAQDQAGMNASGGSNTTTLTTTQLPAHTHTASSGTESATHTHNTPSIYDSASDLGVYNSLLQKQSIRLTASALTAFSAPSATHTHAVTVNSAGTGAAYDSRPAYYSLAFIMKTV